MTLYEKLHSASKEELAQWLTTAYGLIVSHCNEFFKDDPMLGYLSFVGFGQYNVIKERILKDLDTDPERCFLVEGLSDKE